MKKSLLMILVLMSTILTACDGPEYGGVLITLKKQSTLFLLV